MISFFRKGNPRGSHCVCDDRARERLLDLECWDRRTLQLPGQLLPPTVHQLSDQCRKRRSHYQCKIHVPVYRFHYQYKIDWFQNQYKIRRFYYQCRKLLLHYHQNICECHYQCKICRFHYQYKILVSGFIINAGNICYVKLCQKPRL